MPRHTFYLDTQTELYGTISRAVTNLNKTAKANINRQRVQARMDALKSNWQKFQDNHDALQEIKSEADDELLQEMKKVAYYSEGLYAKCEEIYLDAVEQMSCILEEISPAGQADGTLADITAHNISAGLSHSRRLPRIELPKFNGDYCEWSTFRDLFTSLVGANTDLTCVEKLQYLKLSVSGIAAQRLKNVAVTSENFQRAWDTLVHYYDNKRVLVDTYVADLLKSKQVSRESAAELEQLHSEVTQAISALGALDRPVEHWDDLLVHIIVRKLDPSSIKEWEKELGARVTPPTMDELEAFMIGRIRSLQAFERATTTNSKAKIQQPKARCHHASTTAIPSTSTTATISTATTAPKQTKCSLCSNSHYITACTDYQSKSPSQRREFVTQKRLCFNCLGSHLLKNCRVDKRCHLCGSRHHTSLHLRESTPVTSGPPTTLAAPVNPNSAPASVNAVTQADPLVGNASDLLATALVNVRARNGELCEARVLIDQGAQVSLVTENLVQKLSLPRFRASISVVSIGESRSQTPNGEVSLTLESRVADFSCTVRALVLPRLTDYHPSKGMSTQNWNHLQGLPLADPDFLKPRKIDLILGVRVHARILEAGLIKGSHEDPIAQKTALGWIISGPVDSPSSSVSHNFHCSVDRELVDLLQRFWLQEEVFISKTGELSSEEAECENHFVSTHRRDANRVSLVQQTIAEARWHHVDGVDNPADCASRGLAPQQLHSKHLWWTGPSWLTKHSRFWPDSQPGLVDTADLEEKTKLVATVRADPLLGLWELIQRYSQLKKLFRITAWCFRFVNQCRFPNTIQSASDYLTASDIETARIYWVKMTQEAYFTTEIRLLSQGKRLPLSSPLLRLTPFVDSSGLLRIGGRLRNALLDPDTVHPLILPRDSRLSDLILNDVHQSTFHGGTQVMLAHIRRQYWIIGGRTPVRSFVRKCVICARHRALTASQLMGQLPAPRVQKTRPFLHTGVDYAGPFQLKTWRGRGAKTYKGYLVLFVCLSSSALHLELATDYSTDGFLAAYRRFAGRRGVCEKLYSDCGTNFVGADAELRRLFSSASREIRNLAALLAQDGTEWKFNPPSAPHFGGKWEAGVKSVKFHLRRVIGDASLTYEEFSTLLCQIEAVLNSRPLCPLSEDPDDLEALTPAHFLIGTSLITVPEPSVLDLNSSRLSRWQLLRQMIERFWMRWSTEYLHHLQGVSKWQNPSDPVKVGDLVLIADERYPPSKWPMARVIDVHPGTDGLVRVATVRTQSATFKRPIVKLCVLPIDTAIKDLKDSN